jgi:cardiolipin synthase
MEVVNIPNTLTLLRLIAVPIFAVLLLDERNLEALAVFVAAGVTDALDGAIARLTNTKTTLGSYLDPTWSSCSGTCCCSS